MVPPIDDATRHAARYSQHQFDPTCPEAPTLEVQALNALIAREGHPPRFAEELGWLADDVLEPLRRTDELGQAMNFGAAVEGLKVIREFLTAFAWMEGKYEPTNFASQVAQHLQEVKRSVDGIRSFDPNSSNAAGERQSFHTQVDNERSWFAERVGPVVRAAENVEIGAALAELRRTRDDVKAAAAEADIALTTIRQAAGEKGTSELARFFAEQANGHRGAAAQFFWGIVAGIVVLVVSSIILLFANPITLKLEDAASWIEFTRQLLPRAFVLFVLAYLIRFASRGYNVNKHLQVVNEQRSNVLRTFPQLVASNATDEGKDRMATLLASSAVTGVDSGYLRDGEDKGLDSQLLAMAELFRR